MKSVVFGAWVCVALAACSGSSSTKNATQLAAKVNDSEISVHLVNQQLARMSAVPEDRRAQATRRVLDGLIDQQLLIDQAIEKKLDRDPAVLATIEDARRQILAQAYAQKTLGAKAQPTEAEIKQYYADNAPLFGERKVYRLREVSARVPADRAEAFRTMAAKLRSLPEAAPWLRENRIEFAANEAVRPAERLPMNSLKRLATMKDGEIGVFENDNGTMSLLQVASAQVAPISEKDATPAIEQYFVNTRRDQFVREELKRLRGGAKIEYVGDYAKLAPADAAPADAATAPVPADAAAVPANAAAAPAAAAPAAASQAPAAEAHQNGALDKGVAGLR